MLSGISSCDAGGIDLLRFWTSYECTLVTVLTVRNSPFWYLETSLITDKLPALLEVC